MPFRAVSPGRGQLPSRCAAPASRVGWTGSRAASVGCRPSRAGRRARAHWCAPLGAAVDHLWCGAWPKALAPLGALLVAGRRSRWEAADRRLREAWRHDAASRAAQPPGTRVPSSPEPARLLAARNRVCLVEPGRPTWTGDRVRAADERVFTAYGLDLDAVWPRLWMLAGGDERGELRAARQAYDAATRLAGWGVLYLLLGLWWWPALVVAAVVLVLGVRRGRAAMDTFCVLAESVVDLHCRELAEQLGLRCDERLPVPLGRTITTMLRKDV
jgi:hypothetical protein